ncbi:MAG: hypothetical protein Q8L48_11910 [Archangium sp.]|nr:hypothetical protein [Archangium sp.]
MARLVFAAVALLCVSCGLSEAEVSDPNDLQLSTAEGELRTNRDADRVVVYSNNVENMIFDWKDLVHHMGEHELRPDVFLVQQVTGRDGLDRLMGFMKTRLGVDYDGLVAQNQPTDRRFSGEVQPRPKVSTGVVWRSSRFELVSHDSWMPFGTGFSSGAQSCDGRSNHSGYETLRVKLFDRVAKKHVVVISLRHWTWEPCSTKNLVELVGGKEGVNAHVGIGPQADLAIVGGDFNDHPVDGSGQYKCWYRQMVRDISEAQCANESNFGFTDPMFESCNGERSCVRKVEGIDSLFARRADGTPVKTNHFEIISWEEAHRASVRSTGGDGRSNLQSRDGYVDQADRYSGHEARRAYFFYQ